MKHTFLFLALPTALLVHAQAPNTQWLRTAGGFDQFELYRSAADATGHIYTVGLGSAMDFGNGITVPAGRVIARYDSSGTINWARALTTTANELAGINAIATNSHGELWITGHILSATLTLDTIVLHNGSSNTSAFLARFDSTGAVEFAKAWGGASSSVTDALDLCIDGQNQVHVTGYSHDASFIVDGISLSNTSAQDQLYALRFDAMGTADQGIMSNATGGDVKGLCIATDASDNAYVVASCTGVLALGDSTLNVGIVQDGVLIKLSSDGGVERMGIIAQCEPLDLTVDAVGNAYVCGDIQNTAIFDTDTLVPSVLDGFVAAYDSDGHYRWVVGVQGDIDNELCWSVTLDAGQTGLFVGGTFVFHAWFGDVYMATGSSPTDGFMMQMDTAGTVNWVKDMTGDGPTLYAQACMDPWDHLYASGLTQSTSIYLDGPVLNGSGNHAFLARFGNLGLAVPTLARSADALLYPNPTSGTFTLDLPTNARAVVITDAQGREQEHISLTGSHTASFHITMPGVYFVKVITDTGSEVQRMVVQ